MIRDQKDLELAYEIIRLCDKAQDKFDNPEKSKKTITELKHEVRRYTKQEDTKRKVIKEYGIDGFIELIDLPEEVTTLSEAAQYFLENIKIECSPTCYGCTGKLFTGWFKVFRRNDRYIIYHMVCRDV